MSTSQNYDLNYQMEELSACHVIGKPQHGDVEDKNYMQEALKTAKENGYDNAIADECLKAWKEHDTVSLHDYASILLDPLFFQALGKGLGWKTKEQYIADGEEDPSGVKDQWRYEWRRFIDHLAEGKDIESFFTNLLN
jgi:hypothetical protein